MISGFDLVSVYQGKERCPECAEEFVGDDHYLPFETFAGLNGELPPLFHISVPEELKEEMESYLNELIDSDDVLSADNDDQYVEYHDSIRIPLIRVFGSPILSLLNRLQDLTDVSEAAIPIDGIAYSAFFSDKIHIDIPWLKDIPQDIIEGIFVVGFSDIVRMLRLCHGTGVWENNADVLALKYYPFVGDKIIAHREDIMQKLMRHGIEREKEHFVLWRLFGAARLGSFRMRIYAKCRIRAYPMSISAL